jgi:hypothetical protein
MIYVLAPQANETFVNMPSGLTYTSDINCIIYLDNNSILDQLALMAAGCQVLNPTSALGPVAAGGGSVSAVTTAALAACAYANGAAGIGATLTATANGAFPSVDSVSSVLNNRYLIRRQVDMTQNGVYKLTTLGTGGTPWILTRATDADSSSELANILVTSAGGTTYTGRRFWLPLPASAIVVGTTNLAFTYAD